jgi:hypothetical protein
MGCFASLTPFTLSFSLTLCGWFWFLVSRFVVLGPVARVWVHFFLSLLHRLGLLALRVMMMTAYQWCFILSIAGVWRYDV